MLGYSCYSIIQEAVVNNNKLDGDLSGYVVCVCT